MNHSFRRPAMLDPQDAEEIVGDEDPAVESEMAHSTALALMGIASSDFGEDDIPKVLQAVRTQGVDVIAGSWSRSPEFTLPGALWRLYLLWQWHQMNPEILQERYLDGKTAMERQGVANQHTVPDLDEVILAVEGVMGGYATDDDLAPVLEGAAALLRVLATGVSFGPEWITDDQHALAHPVTRRPTALIDTANELEESARQAQAGQLD